MVRADNAKAVADFTAALRLDPKIENGPLPTGSSLQCAEGIRQGRRRFQSRIEHDPDYPNLLCACTWQLATCPGCEVPRRQEGDTNSPRRRTRTFEWEVAEPRWRLVRGGLPRQGSWKEAVKWQEEGHRTVCRKGKGPSRRWQSHAAAASSNTKNPEACTVQESTCRSLVELDVRHILRDPIRLAGW